jgi:hypothetical protein
MRRMTSPNLQPNLYGASPDALFDHLECDLVALTTAALDDDDIVPTQVVDEFATEFLMDLTKPPSNSRHR